MAGIVVRIATFNTTSLFKLEPRIRALHSYVASWKLGTSAWLSSWLNESQAEIKEQGVFDANRTWDKSNAVSSVNTTERESGRTVTHFCCGLSDLVLV